MIVIKLILAVTFLALWIAGTVLAITTIVDSIKTFKK